MIPDPRLEDDVCRRFYIALRISSPAFKPSERAVPCEQPFVATTAISCKLFLWFMKPNNCEL